MIAEVRGTIVAKSGDLITVLTASGVGYEIAVPVGVLERLPGTGSEIRLHTNLVVREDSWALFGFDRPSDREIFQRLLQANGVGPRLALGVLSALGGDRVVRAVVNGDLAALCTVPGVGKKKAERMVLELKDRMRDLEIPDEVKGPPPAGQQAVAALVNLGYAQFEAEEAVRATIAQNEGAETAELIRETLNQLSGGR